MNLDYLIKHNIIKKPDLIEVESQLKNSKTAHNLFKKNKFKLSSNRNDNFIYSK